jgi:hypothetical protein
MAGRSRVNRGVAALGKQLSGQSLTTAESNALTWLQHVVGARRPLSEYAPRTRRRYVAKARAMPTASGGPTEYQRRKAAVALKTGGLTPKQYTEFNKLIKRRNDAFRARGSTGVENESVVDWDTVSNFVEAFGYQHVKTILVEELDSIDAYVNRHDRGPGNQRWFRRDNEVYKPNFNDRLANTDILYYYHGTRQ